MTSDLPWYTNLVNYLVTRQLPPYLTRAQKDKIRSDSKYYVWDDPYLWKFCADQLIRRCIPQHEQHSILSFCHSYACGGHFGPKRTTFKVLESGFYWPKMYKDARNFVKNCDRCQRFGNISKKDQAPMKYILTLDIFYGTFSSFRWQAIHLSSDGLCFKVGRSASYGNK